MNLTSYRTLGRSGLVVSPFALGTMTFGNREWGSTDDVSRAIFDAYVDAGGNFVDTADVYAGGRSEEIVGDFIAERKLRDQIVLATKFGFNAAQGNPHASGNGRKNIYRAVEGSLRRLRTDYVDMYWLHIWDAVTPVEEVLQTFGDLVRTGKVRAFGLSNVPAWYATRMATLAAAHNMPGPIALQFAYSLVERTIEYEHVPAARECGMGIVPWSPLAYGLLTGKYRRGQERSSNQGRLSGSNPFGDTLFTERNYRVVEGLRSVAEQVGRPMAQVALAWAMAQPGVASLLLGVSKVEQLHDNLASLDLQLTAEQLGTLDEISSPDPLLQYSLFKGEVNRSVFGGNDVQGWH